jgi:hypothetical protein
MRLVLMLGALAAVMAGRQAHGVSVGPRTMRFLRQEAAAGGKAEVAAEMKIGPCGCDFLSGVTATKPVGSTANCAPISALCMFCENAAYAGYWTPDVDTCEPYEGKAKGVCEAVAGAAKGLASKMKPLYAAYGPQFGASGVVCRDGGCCPKEPGK